MKFPSLRKFDPKRNVCKKWFFIIFEIKKIRFINNVLMCLISSINCQRIINQNYFLVFIVVDDFHHVYSITSKILGTLNHVSNKLLQWLTK